MRWTTALLLAGCGTGLPDWYEEQPWDWRELVVEVAPAFDPKLDDVGTLPVRVVIPSWVPDACRVRVVMTTTSGHQHVLGPAPATSGPDGAVFEWDGRVEGAYADPGRVQAAAELRCSERLAGFGEAWTHVVRLGPASIASVGDDQVPLLWYRRDLVTRGLSWLPDDAPAWSLGDGLLDDEQGDARTSPVIWTDPAAPPWGLDDYDAEGPLNVPVAYVAGGEWVIEVIPGELARSARTGVVLDAQGPTSAPEMRATPEGFTPLGDGTWEPGVPVRYRAPIADRVSATLGRYEIEIDWRFEARSGAEWEPVPGHATTTHRVYVLAGPTAVPDGTAHGASPARSWIAVLEDLLPAYHGRVADDPRGVLDALRDELHQNPWFIYNPNDNSYSSFQGPYIYWSRIWTEMSDFLDRRQGLQLYCHSVACLLASQANHLGIDAEYVTIVHELHPTTGRGFTTNLTRAAGRDNWRQWTFNSHGITGLGGFVWDAAVDIDGDEVPWAEPVQPIGPKSLPLDDYFSLLTADPMVVVNGGRCDNY